MWSGNRSGLREAGHGHDPTTSEFGAFGSACFVSSIDGVPTASSLGSAPRAPRPAPWDAPRGTRPGWFSARRASFRASMGYPQRHPWVARPAPRAPRRGTRPVGRAQVGFLPARLGGLRSVVPSWMKLRRIVDVHHVGIRHVAVKPARLFARRRRCSPIGSFRLVCPLVASSGFSDDRCTTPDRTSRRCVGAKTQGSGRSASRIRGLARRTIPTIQYCSVRSWNVCSLGSRICAVSRSCQVPQS